MEQQTVKNLNVFLLGLAFMLVFAAFQTMGNVQTVILDSAKNTTSGGYVEGFTGDGFTSLAIVYAVFSIANWFAPPVVSKIGPRFTLLLGGVCYACFIAQLIYPNNYLLYCASALVGFGAAMIWVAQGNFLTLNSDQATMERNSGLFWAMLQCSLLIGNTFVYFQFQGLEDIDKDTRTKVAAVLLSICLCGVLTFLTLRPTPWASESDNAANSTPLEVFLGAFKLMATPRMLMLAVTFCYTGLMLTFWSGVYGTSIGRTKKFGEDAKSLVGLHGIVIGAGEIIGGLSFGIFGKHLARFGRHYPVLLGFVVHIGAMVIAFMNLPFRSPIEDTTEAAYLDPPSQELAIFGSFCLGLGDACYNTQIYSIIGSVFKDDSAAGFAIFKFAQSAMAAAAFFYSNQIELPYQLLILVVLCVLGTATFCIVELQTRKNQQLLPLGTETPATLIEDNSCGIIATNSSNSDDQAPVVEKA